MPARKILPERRSQILHVYLTCGFTAASPLAVAHGISPKAMSKWARKAGHTGKRGRELGVWKTMLARPPKPARIVKPKIRQPMQDRRWAWAIERGEVRL